MIYKAEDKNNNRLNRRLICGPILVFMNDANLKELHLDGWLLT
jgi:hypothetical protein